MDWIKPSEGPAIDFGIAISVKDMIKAHSKKTGIDEEDLIKILNYYYRDINWAKANFYHPRIYVEGLGTFRFRYNKVPPVFRADGDLPHLSPYMRIYKVHEEESKIRAEKYERKKKGELTESTKKLREKGDHKNRKR